MPVRLSEIVGDLSILPDHATLYIHQKTGELVLAMHDDMRVIEQDEHLDFEDMPEWQRDLFKTLRRVQTSADFIALPSKFDIHEWQIMRDFCDTIEMERLKQELLDAIHGRGAFRSFKNVIHHHGIPDDWYAFRDATIEKAVIAFLDDHSIAWTR